VADNDREFSRVPGLTDRERVAGGMIHLRLDLDGPGRHLARSGHDALMHEVEKAAAKSGAPFLAADKPLGEAGTRWSQARDAPGRGPTFPRLQVGRGVRRRATEAGRIWEDRADT
jgi:DNA primase